MKRALFFLTLFLTLTASAQTTKVKGAVLDAETGEPVPFASVYFDGTVIGISSDLEGRFSIETRSKDITTLTAHLIGYEPETVPVAKGSFSEVEFRLRKDLRQLEAALVRPDDRYIRSILGRIDQARKRHDPERADAWQTRLYSKIELDATHAEDLIDKTFLKGPLGFVLDYRDTSAVTGTPYIPIMISETVSRKYHALEPSVDKEIIEASRISGLEQDNILRQFAGSYLLKTNFYHSQVSVFNLDIPSPASAAGHPFYNYYLVDSLQVEGRKTYTLRFHPKRLVTSPALDGEMNVDAEDFAIRSVHASLASKSNVNWIRHINVDIENQRLPDGKWFSREERLFIDFSISVSDKSKVVSFLGNRTIVYSDTSFGAFPEMEGLSGGDRVQVGPEPDKDLAYWDGTRPYDLTEREQGIFRMTDRLKGTSAYKWTYGIANMFITGFAESRKLGIGYGPWARTLTFNDVEGVRVQAGFRTTKEFSKTVRFRGALGYGFKDREFKGNASTEFIFNRERTRKLTLYASREYEQLGRGSGVLTEQNIFNSLLAQGGFNKQSMLFKAGADYRHEFSPGFNAGLEIQHLRLYGNDVVPLIRPDGEADASFSVNQVHWSGRFSWNERVNRGFFDKEYIFTRYPVITVDLLSGIKGLTSGDCSFYRGELTVDWRVPAGAVGFGRLHVNGGAILGSVPYPLLKLHEGNQTYFMDRSAFSCMDYYEFASDRWITASYEHNLNGFILGKIPLVNRLDLREVFTVRTAWGTISEQNRGERARYDYGILGMGALEKPYVEAGIGISNIFRIFRVDGFWRLTHWKNRNFVINIALDVDF
ncbi:MAG: carboxypeptidase-like regulatory domain-containing protein [Bacteroidales bacterium]|nr:carboxypeptidase-like regulatory domain-containing protein [Bacteroidales bacterium]